MNLGWSENELRSYQEVIEYAQKELNGDLIQEDKEGTFSHQRWNNCGMVGLLGLPVPKEYGGAGLEPATCVLMLEGLGYGCQDNGLFLALGAHTWAVEVPIWKFGNEEQRKAFLPRLCSGEWIGSHAVSEPGSGSDAMALSTQATRDDEYYILNGRKTFITNGPIADLFIVFATINQKLGFTGVTAFLVERGTPGLYVEAAKQKMGLRTAQMSDIVFENCKIPVENRLGREKEGQRIFATVMKWERALILAPLLGSMHRQIQECVQYANSRVQFGKRIAEFQSVANKVVDMQVRLEASRLLTYKAACMLQRNEESMFSEIAKLETSEAAMQTFMDAVSVHGGYGYMTEREIERHFRDAVGTKLYSGTSDMQRLLIASKLGLR